MDSSRSRVAIFSSSVSPSRRSWSGSSGPGLARFQKATGETSDVPGVNLGPCLSAASTSWLADTAVLDVAGSTGQGTGLVPELAQVRAAHKLALAVTAVDRVARKR